MYMKGVWTVKSLPKVPLWRPFEGPTITFSNSSGPAKQKTKVSDAVREGSLHLWCHYLAKRPTMLSDVHLVPLAGKHLLWFWLIHSMMWKHGVIRKMGSTCHIANCRQRNTDPQPQVTYIKLGRVVFFDIWADRHTDTRPPPTRCKVIRISIVL